MLGKMVRNLVEQMSFVRSNMRSLYAEAQSTPSANELIRDRCMMRPYKRTIEYLEDILTVCAELNGQMRVSMQN